MKCISFGKFLSKHYVSMIYIFSNNGILKDFVFDFDTRLDKIIDGIK